MQMLRQARHLIDRYFFIIASIIIGCKIALSLFAQVEYDGSRQLATGVDWQWRKDYSAIFSGDEYEMARTAMYYLNGQGFLADNHFGRPQFREFQTYKTAFRPKFNIFLHVLGIPLYNRLNPIRAVMDTGNMQRGNPLAQGYMYWFGLFTFLVQVLVYPLSIFAFYRLCGFFAAGVHAKICTMVYAAYPSVFIFMDITVGEKMAGPIVVIFIAGLLASLTEKISVVRIIALSVAITFACLMRPHALFVWVVLFIICAIIASYLFFRYRTRPMGVRLMLVSGIFIFLAHLPVLYVHYEDFGKPFLSSQAGLEFFQGHNWYARGSWYPGIWQEHAKDKEMMRMFASAHDLVRLDEKQELDFYASQGWRFIRENPLKEVELIARKTAIYLLPYNFMNHRINLFLLFAHLGTLGFFVFSVRKRIFGSDDPPQIMRYVIIIAPVMACYGLTLIFFVGERWRFYAEPFMVLLAYLFFLDVRKKILARSTQSKQV